MHKNPTKNVRLQQKEVEVNPLTTEQKARVVKIYNRTVCFILCILEMLRKTVELLTSDANASTLAPRQQQRLFQKLNIMVSSLHLHKAINLFMNHNKPLKGIQSFKPLKQKWTLHWITTSHIDHTISVLLLCEISDVSLSEDDFATLSSIGGTVAWLQNPEEGKTVRVSFKIYDADPKTQTTCLNRLFTLLTAQPTGTTESAE